MVPRKEAALQTNTAVGDGIMVGRDASDDNAHADKGNRDDPPETIQRNGNSEEETTSAAENGEQSHKGKAQPRREDQTRETEYTKDAEKTEIMHLVAKRPEMPEEMDLNRESRKQLSGLMLEYPTKRRDGGRSRRDRAAQKLHMSQL